MVGYYLKLLRQRFSELKISAQGKLRNFHERGVKTDASGAGVCWKSSQGARDLAGAAARSASVSGACGGGGGVEDHTDVGGVTADGWGVTFSSWALWAVAVPVGQTSANSITGFGGTL